MSTSNQPAAGRTPVFLRSAALVCGLLYFPCGLVWAYGFALAALPLALAGFWLLRAAARREAQAGVPPAAGMRRLHAIARVVLIAGVVASVVALVATK